MALTKAQRHRIEHYDRDNRQCSRLILADIRKYGGEGSLAVRWARTVRSKREPTSKQEDLFGEVPATKPLGRHCAPEQETAECVLSRF